MKPLVVLGDTLLDIDAEGTADRLSPEAPVPVVDLTGRRVRPGGAGLAALLAARSAEVVLVTALGNDAHGRVLAGLLEPEMTVLGVPLCGGTVCKTRVRVGGQSLLRMDSGDGTAAASPLPRPVTAALRGAGAVLVADYGRGMTSNPHVRRLLGELASQVPVVWDPHPRGGDPVVGARLVTPNASEAAGCGADELRSRWNVDAVAVTLGERGAALADATGVTVVPAPRNVHGGDTCGAGDSFAAAAAAALLAGATTLDAVTTAVQAAARFVAAGGAGTLSTLDSVAPAVLGSADPFDLADRVRTSGGRLVATGGCFDLLHPGHVSLLRQARALGDALVVCLNSDSSVRGLKGPGRPLLSAHDRARLLTELACVDAVAVFDEPSPVELLDRLRPHVWVKGADYTTDQLPEHDVVHRHGGEIVLVPVLPGYSTTRLVAAAAGH
ncbi:PfkB family carbohydrate kinase [Kibdelosporangium lantanae]